MAHFGWSVEVAASRNKYSQFIMMTASRLPLPLNALLDSLLDGYGHMYQ